MKEIEFMENVEILSKSNSNKLISYIFILAVFSLLLSTFDNDSYATNLKGELVSKNEIIKSTIYTLFIGLPMFGFILGKFVSLFPYKNAKFNKNYLRASLYSTIFLELIFFILTLILKIISFF